MREICISPDGNSVAIRTDFPEESQMAWGVMGVGPEGQFSLAGGHWAATKELEGWTMLDTPSAPDPVES